MIPITKMNILEVNFLAKYLLEKRNNIEQVLEDFGEVSHTNGYGTFFLKPKNPIFKVFWIMQEKGKINSVGFGGVDFSIKVSDIYKSYSDYREKYIPYDDEYVYVFFNPLNHTHNIKISAKNRIMEKQRLLQDIDINGMEIILN